MYDTISNMLGKLYDQLIGPNFELFLQIEDKKSTKILLRNWNN